MEEFSEAPRASPAHAFFGQQKAGNGGGEQGGGSPVLGPEVPLKEAEMN